MVTPNFNTLLLVIIFLMLQPLNGDSIGKKKIYIFNHYENLV